MSAEYCKTCGSRPCLCEAWNTNSLVPETARDDGAELSSSAWVAEWEAALSTAEKMMKETETKEGSIYYYWQGRYDEAESALDRVRHHSATAGDERAAGGNRELKD